MAGRIHIVLFQPEIPQNTGNIARTCACAGADLHLVHPLGFHLTERNIRRSGMDYFEHVNVTQWESSEAFLEAHGSDELYMFTGQTTQLFSEIDFKKCTAGADVYLCFGRESAGIDDDILQRYCDRCVRIPMIPGRRSLNLANSVAIGLYEAMRQIGYPGMA